MILPNAAAKYSRDGQNRLQSLIEQADRENRKQGRDIEVYPARIILTSPNGTRYRIDVSNAGALSAVAV